MVCSHFIHTHTGFTCSRHIRNFIKSASASFFCSFYHTFNKIQVYVRHTPYYKLRKFTYGKCGTKTNVWLWEFSKRCCSIFKFSGLWPHADGQIVTDTSELRSLETLVISYQSTYYNIPKVVNLQWYWNVISPSSPKSDKLCKLIFFVFIVCVSRAGPTTTWFHNSNSILWAR